MSLPNPLKQNKKNLHMYKYGVMRFCAYTNEIVKLKTTINNFIRPPLFKVNVILKFHKN